MDKEKPKIFLSYAHEDIGMAKRIYQDLKRYGLNIWFDNVSLLGGQNWKFEINKAIKESTYFLALLSKESIDSIGYIQKELKIALEMLDLYPKNKTYILPVRIENCEPIEERLSDLHWINVFPENEYQNGLKKILQVVSPGIFIIRNEPKELSYKDVNEIIKIHDYFDGYKNPQGKGIEHDYKLKEIHGVKVVIDEATKLMWEQGGSSQEMEFKYAKKRIIMLNERSFFKGFDGWRLPTLEEGISLIERKKINKLFIDPIFEDKQNWIWTADLEKGKLKVWVINFENGYCDRNNLGSINFVRAVRSGR